MSFFQILYLYLFLVVLGSGADEFLDAELHSSKFDHVKFVDLDTLQLPTKKHTIKIKLKKDDQ